MWAAIRRIDQKLFEPFGQYPRLLSEAIGDAATLLDVGCGSSSPIQYLPRRFDRVVGVDGFQPSLDRARTLGCHHELIRMELLDIGSRFPAKSFDCVVALDVIEHFEKQDGLRLLDMMEGIARRRVAIFTPNGFLPQGEFDNNPYQLHRSGWSVSEMQDRGYRTIGVSGWKPLFGDYATVRFRPTWLWTRVALITRPVFERWPSQAFQILCVKELR